MNLPNTTYVFTKTRGGDVYNVEYKNGSNSHGTCTYGNGDRYKREWKDGKRNGQGTYTHARGTYTTHASADTCKGEWRKAQHCFGTDTHTIGDVYKGEWKNDKKHGRGTSTFASGAVYNGEYNDDKAHGQGTCTYANGSVYDGEWKDGWRNGHGTCTCANGTVYNGEWKNGMRYGKGENTSASGKVCKGEWKYGKYLDPATCSFALQFSQR